MRKNNQDSAYVSPSMLMVADGMGGAAAGDLASAVAIDELRQTDADVKSFNETENDLNDPDLLDVIGGAIARANDRIRDLVSLDPSLDGMGTTVCGVLFDGERLAVANIGDSRAYRQRDGVFERITRDHSWVQTLVDDGRITEAEALVHPHRSLILKVLNGQPTHSPDLELADIAEGDRYLICSDGLCGMVTDDAIEAVIGGEDRDQVIDQLVKIAYDEGGLDNVTIILADVVTDADPGPVMVLGAATEIDVDAPLTEAEDTRPLPLDGSAATLSPEDAERARYQPTTKGRAGAWVKVVLGIVLPLMVIGGGLFGWWSYTQTKFYVGDSNDAVAVFRGVPDKVFGVSLSTVLEVHNTKVDDLPLYYQQQVRDAIVVPDLEAAARTTEHLHDLAVKCIAQREERSNATTKPTPTPTDSATASSTATASNPATSPTGTPRPHRPPPRPHPDDQRRTHAQGA